MKDLSEILELSLDEMSEWGVMDWRRKYLSVPDPENPYPLSPFKAR